MKSTLATIFLLGTVAAAMAEDDASQPVPVRTETLSQELIAPPATLPPFDDSFFENVSGDVPFVTDQPNVSAEQLRRDAEMSSRTPAHPVLSPQFGNPEFSSGNYRLQQQIRDLSNYVRQLQEQQEPAVPDGDPADPWTKWEAQ